MDRTFNFFDHPSPVRQSPNGNIPHSSSPSLLPNNGVLSHQQPSNQQTHLQLHQQSQLHQSQQPQHIRHPQHFQQQSRHLESHRLQRPQTHHGYQSSSQHPAQQQQRPSSHHPQMQQQLPLQPMDPHHQDPASAPAILTSPQTTSQQPHLQHQSRHQQPPSTQHCQPHQLHMPQFQQPRPHHRAQHSQGRQHPQPSSTHQQQHISGFHLNQTVPQVGSLAFSTGGAGNAFPGTSAFVQNSAQFGPSLARDSQHTPFQMHSQKTLAQTGISPPSNPNNSFAGAQQLQVQPILSGQQPSQAQFGSIASIPSSMLPGNVVDDPAGSSQHFSNSQSGEALSGPYPWDPTHSQNALGSQTLAGHQNQQQSLLPLPLGGDTRTSNGVNNAASTSAFANQQPGSGQNAFGGVLNTTMGVLGSSLNTAMVSGLTNGSSLGTNVGPSISSSGTEISHRKDALTVADGASRTGKTVKKSRNAMPRKAVSGRVRGAHAIQPVQVPITSPVTAVTLPDLRHLAHGKATGTEPNRSVRPSRGGRVRVHGRGRVADSDLGHRQGFTSSSAAVVLVPSVSAGGPSHCGSSSAAVTSPQPVRSPINSNKNATSSAAWPMKKTSSLRVRKSRRTGDGTGATTVPVHLRNPKKGRARVFRDCRQCKSENHIRRSDCLQCKAPLPAGKRRRDGNPSYDKKHSAPSPVPDARAISQHVGHSRAGAKDDGPISSVIDK